MTTLLTYSYTVDNAELLHIMPQVMSQNDEKVCTPEKENQHAVDQEIPIEEINSTNSEQSKYRWKNTLSNIKS